MPAPTPLPTAATLAARPGLLLLLQIVTDVDLLAPIAAAARRDGRFDVRVLVVDTALRKTPELAPQLARAFGDGGYAVVDGDALLHDRAPDLASVHAVLAATESTAIAHRFAHRLAQRANAARLHTATLQHGFDNLGLTWFDAQHPPAAVQFASRTIFTWGPRERLHADVLATTRARCVPIGCPKPARPELALPPRPGERARCIAVFENLHWDRFGDDYRARFLADLEAIAATQRDTTFFVKPHPAGKWLTQRFAGPRPRGDNLVIAMPGAAEWDRYDAATVLALADAVVTTPSTIALDAARRGLPVAVAAYDLALPAYAPLRTLVDQDGWRQFVECTRSDAARAAERDRAERFVAANVLAGDAAAAIVDHLHALVAAGPAPAIASEPARVTFAAPRDERRGLRRLLDRLRGVQPLPHAPSYVADAGDHELSAGAEHVLATALRATAASGAPWPKALLWDDACFTLHWRKRRLRVFGVRRAHRDAASLAITDLRLAGAVRADLAGSDPTAVLRELLLREPASVQFVGGVWRCLGLAAEGRGLLDVPPPPAPRAQRLSVLVNFRDLADETIACIASVAAQRTTAAIELLLVDNQSRPESRIEVVTAAERLAAQRGNMDVRLLPHDEAYNHSRQNNRAAALATGDVLVFLNNDARLLSPDLLQQLADEALRPGVATVGPRIVGRGGQLICSGMTWSQIPAPGPLRKETRLREHEGPHGADRRRGSLGASFCCAAIARATWQTSGGLDEVAFPTQYNDADFCLRLAARGLQHLHRGDLVAYHQPGGSEARDVNAIRRLHEALLARHAGADFDHRVPDHYELPGAVQFAGGDGECWRWLLRAQQPDAAAAAAAAPLAEFASEVVRQLAGVPTHAAAPGDELAAQWRGVRCLVEATFAQQGERVPASVRNGWARLLQRAGQPLADTAIAHIAAR